MAAGDLVVANYQAELQEVLLGDGTAYHWTRDEIAIWGLPEVRGSQMPRPRDHGLAMGQDLFSGRQVLLPIRVLGSTPADTQTKLNTLVGAFAPVSAPVPLVFQLPEGKRRIYGAPQRVKVVGRLVRHSVLDAVAEFYATDPRIYDDAETTTAIALPSASGGLDWPVSWPVAWGSGAAATVTLTNAGTYPTRIVVSFIGPLTSPSIENVSTGEVWASSLDIGSGDTLIVDFDARTVLLNGTASRYSTVLSSTVWWELAPGSTQVRIAAAAGSGSASVTFRSAWI